MFIVAVSMSLVNIKPEKAAVLRQFNESRIGK